MIESCKKRRRRQHYCSQPPCCILMQKVSAFAVQDLHQEHIFFHCFGGNRNQLIPMLAEKDIEKSAMRVAETYIDNAWTSIYRVKTDGIYGNA